MTSALCSRVIVKHRHCLRCLYSTDPQDTVGPPTKAWRYVLNKFTNFVTKYENKLENKSPKAFKVYKTMKSVRYVTSDMKDYVSVSKDMWSGRELHTFSRRELEIYQEFPKDITKIVTLLFLAAIPFIGNGFIVIGYMYPRLFFTHHLWNEEQKVEFGQYFHKHKLSHYHNLLEHFDKQVERHTDGQTQEQLRIILDEIASSSHPTVDELLQVKTQFESFPFSVDDVPTVYFRHLALVCNFSKRRAQLKQDGLILLHIDRAMMREGIENLTEYEMCKSCLKRGLNPYGITREERIKFLQMWTQLSQQLDEKNVSLLLHCPVFLTYNSATNIQLMKGKKYKWHRKRGGLKLRKILSSKGKKKDSDKV